MLGNYLYYFNFMHLFNLLTFASCGYWLLFGRHGCLSYRAHVFTSLSPHLYPLTHTTSHLMLGEIRKIKINFYFSLTPNWVHLMCFRMSKFFFLLLQASCWSSITWMTRKEHRFNSSVGLLDDTLDFKIVLPITSL